jgi:hypothetical protein
VHPGEVHAAPAVTERLPHLAVGGGRCCHFGRNWQQGQQDGPLSASCRSPRNGRPWVAAEWQWIERVHDRVAPRARRTPVRSSWSISS